MGLEGQLEDLPLLDMLQIIAFSKKSGFLRVDGAPGRGAVVLKEGRILFAWSWSTASALKDLTSAGEAAPKLLRAHVEASLRELTSLREGTFQFELTETFSEGFDGVESKDLMLEDGLDPQEIFLDMAVELDQERREATTLVELAFRESVPDEPVAEESEEETSARPVGALEELDDETRSAPFEFQEERHLSPKPERVTVVIVDDERPVREVLAKELQSKGYRVWTANDPVNGAGLVRDGRQWDEVVVLIADLKMPTSSQRSFYGGFELIRRVKRCAAGVPVLLMVEGLSERVRARAKELGVRRVVFKPTLTKLDPGLYRSELKQFAGIVEEQVRKLLEDQLRLTSENGKLTGPITTEEERIDFLAIMTKKLVEPGASTDVSRLALDVACRFLERGVLFVVRGDSARGLAGFGFGTDEAEGNSLAQGIVVEIASCAPIGEAIRTGASHRTAELSSFGSFLYSRIGHGRAKEAVLMPVLYNRATCLLLYGDNGVSGRALGDLGGLELFMAQAGLALENKLLQQKLSAAQPGSVVSWSNER